MLPTTELRDWVTSFYGIAPTANNDTIRLYALRAMESGELTAEKMAELQGIGNKNKTLENKQTGAKDMQTTETETTANKSTAQAFGGARVDVKPASAMYKTERVTGKHYRTGQPVLNELGREVTLPSEVEYAKSGAFLKFLAGRNGLNVGLNDHERELVEESFRDTWVGAINGEWSKSIPGVRVKALLSDATSGGVEVNPAWFDDALIQFPLLHGELFPFVDLRDVPRGASVEGASVGNPSVTWGIGEGTSIPLFDTASLIAEINSSIFPVTCAIEVGRDLLADSASDVGRALVENIGQVMLNELDDIVANGDGTTQPQGIFVASGVTDVGSPAGGAGAAPQIDDYEALLFGIGKQYRRKEWNPAFIANDVSYRRARSIEVGASDAQRILGLNYSSYQILEHRYAIQNDISNAVQGFGCLKKYRMYRRQGAEVRWETGGKELTRRNLALLVVRGRYGGRVVDANAFCKRDDAQA